MKKDVAIFKWKGYSNSGTTAGRNVEDDVNAVLTITATFIDENYEPIKSTGAVLNGVVLYSDYYQTTLRTNEVVEGRAWVSFFPTEDNVRINRINSYGVKYNYYIPAKNYMNDLGVKTFLKVDLRFY